MKSLLFSIALGFAGASLAKDIEKSICGVDDRLPSTNPKVARALSSRTGAGGCTLTMISRTCGISAGHCLSVLKVAEFNTPPSQNGRIVHPEPEDVYEVNQQTIKSQDAGVGRDWAVFDVLPNNVTGKLAGDLQGFYPVSFEAAKEGDVIRITGYGTDRSDPERHLAQQTHTGNVIKSRGATTLSHVADTMGGNSGSSIIKEETGEVVGIHTHGGCRSTGGNNSATMLATHTQFVAAVKACLEREENL